METPATSSKSNTLEPEDSRYLVRSRMEIAAILRAVMDAGEMVTVYLDNRKDFILTAFLAVDSAKNVAWLDSGKDPELNKRVLNAKRIVVVTRQDKVKIQFELPGVQSTQYQGHPALSIALPATLLKFQRREFFRVETPRIKPIVCRMPLSDGGHCDAKLLDISLGGVCITGLPDDLRLDVGVEFAGSKFTLPDEGIVETTLQLRNVLEVQLRSGGVSRRVGFKFIGLPRSAETMIQRYVTKLERERRAKLKDD